MVRLYEELKKGKMFLFSASNNIIVETTIDKIYLKTSSVDIDPALYKFTNSDIYREAKPNETSISSLQYGKIVYIKDEDFDDMILGHKNDRLNKFKAKIRKIFTKKGNH
jgi:hypothetical protein